ncbi:MAG TPA: phosphatidylglycerophosphatase A, partial [Bacillota bacterium]
IQHGFYDRLTLEMCIESVEAVIAKREVQHVLLTGIALDMAAEAGTLPEPLLTILRQDDLLYGVDEVLALGITNVYGSIGLTNFGYLDKQKLGIIGRLNNRVEPGRVHTFLDDLVSGIAAAAAARLAHNAEVRPAESDTAFGPDGPQGA